MFTGIVQGTAQVCAVLAFEDRTRLEIYCDTLTRRAEIGASVAVDGVCLTVVEQRDNVLAFDVIPATRRLTNLGDLSPGVEVNVERSVRMGDEIGGHLFSGHVSGTVVAEFTGEGEFDRVLTCGVSATLMRCLMPKGFVALNGVSLTVAELDRRGGTLSANLIPETLRRTNLSQVTQGDALNLEIDPVTHAVVETVERLVGLGSPR